MQKLSPTNIFELTVYASTYPFLFSLSSVVISKPSFPFKLNNSVSTPVLEATNTQPGWKAAPRYLGQDRSRMVCLPLKTISKHYLTNQH